MIIVECPKNQRKCDGTLCISKDKLCDNNYDCEDETDEMNCIYNGR